MYYGGKSYGLRTFVWLWGTTIFKQLETDSPIKVRTEYAMSKELQNVFFISRKQVTNL